MLKILIVKQLRVQQRFHVLHAVNRKFKNTQTNEPLCSVFRCQALDMSTAYHNHYKLHEKIRMLSGFVMIASIE